MNIKVVCGSQEWNWPRKTKGEAFLTRRNILKACIRNHLEYSRYWKASVQLLHTMRKLLAVSKDLVIAQGLKIAETPFFPKAIVCPWVWPLSPRMVVSVPARSISRILLELWQAGPKPPPMRWPLGHSLAWNFSFTLTVFFYLKISLGAENPMLGLFTFERSYSFTDSVLSDPFSSKCCETVKSCAPESYVMIYTATLQLNCSMMFYMCKKSNTHLVA